MNKYDLALKYEIFEKGEYHLAKKVIENADLILDVGGHVGYFSLWALQFNAQLTIHYFEPFPQQVAQARELLKAYTNQIVFNTFGLAKEAGSYSFLFNAKKTMQSSQFSSFLNTKGEAQTVQCKNLNTYLSDHQIENIDLMKIDIEGMEYEVLSNITDQNWKKLNNLIGEFHLFSNEDRTKWQHLANLLRKKFYNLQIEKNPYSDQVFLFFASEKIEQEASTL